MVTLQKERIFVPRRNARDGSPRASCAGALVMTPAIPDLRRLQAFVVVAEELHFRQAARRLVMAQSPLSRIIKGLEEDIGFALFVRTRRTVKLTCAGEALLNEAHELLGRTERAIERARLAARTEARS